MVWAVSNLYFLTAWWQMLSLWYGPQWTVFCPLAQALALALVVTSWLGLPPLGSYIAVVSSSAFGTRTSFGGGWAYIPVCVHALSCSVMSDSL